MKPCLSALLACALLAGCGHAAAPTSAPRAASHTAAQAMIGADPLDRKLEYAALDYDHDGAVSFDEYQQLGVFGILGPAGKPGTDRLGRMHVTFAMLDADHDGKLSYAELERANFLGSVESLVGTVIAQPDLLTRFLDVDGDGFVDLDEYRALGMYAVTFGGIGETNTPANLARLQEDNFKYYDRNHSGKLGPKEMTEFCRTQAFFVRPAQ